MWCDFWGSANFLASSSRQMVFSVNRGLEMRHKASSATVMALEPVPLTLAPEDSSRQRAGRGVGVEAGEAEGSVPDHNGYLTGMLPRPGPQNGAHLT